MPNPALIKKGLIFSAILIFSFANLVGLNPVTITQPARCKSTPGSITIGGLTANANYTVIYNIDSAVQPAVLINATAGGNLTINNLEAGIYTGIILTPVAGGNAVNISQEIKLIDQCLAIQSVKFLATGYSNFVGVKDDNPTGFAQVYARLSIPIHRSYGIPKDASYIERLILFRNVFLQLTYGNTDKFKLYSFDSSQIRYVNRLDLVAHSYFNANLTFNILTFILPKTFGKHHTEDRMHIYLDAYTSLLLTDVTDSLKKADSANKSYNVKTPLYGFNLKGAWREKRWGLELSYKRYWVFPSANAFNTKMNPQSSNITDIFIPENVDRPLVSSEKKVHAYNSIEALVSYNTSSNPDKNESNIFLRYAYNSNSPSIVSSRYSNNYFQFQLGYSLDITQIFKPQSK